MRYTILFQRGRPKVQSTAVVVPAKGRLRRLPQETEDLEIRQSGAGEMPTEPRSTVTAMIRRSASDRQLCRPQHARAVDALPRVRALRGPVATATCQPNSEKQLPGCARLPICQKQLFFQPPGVVFQILDVCLLGPVLFDQCLILRFQGGQLRFGDERAPRQAAQCE